jgi:hypothetical protein
MHRDFIQIRALQGELKISHKLRDLGITVTTKELVIQKPHLNYHIPLDHIIAIVPYDRSPRDLRYVNQRDSRTEVVQLGSGMNVYKLHVESVLMHSRSGLQRLGRMEFVMPLRDEVLELIGLFAELSMIR